MNSNTGRNNFQTHRLGLYHAAFEFSKTEPNVEIDTNISKFGHIRIQKGGKEYRIMVKALSSGEPVPFNTDYDIINNFYFLVVCTGVYDNIITLYKLPIKYVSERVSSNVDKDGKTNYWLDHPYYRSFKVSALTIP